MSQDEAETEDQRDSWSAVLLEALSAYPEPTSPLYVRAAYAAFLTLAMPIFWPMIMGMMLVIFCLALCLIGITLLFSPVVVLVFGVREEKATERLEVEIDKDKVPAVTAAVHDVGGKISRR